jgi:transcriptional regulator GlxA family with amidase domain
LIYHTAVDTLITTADAVPPARVAADSSVRNDAPDTLFPPVKEPFHLPGYTFHVVFLLASAAVIVAALRFFWLLRRRNDSRRFLTTTRLSVLDKSVQRGCRHIEANYGDPALTPDAVCRSLVTGKACLDALFINELGINVQDFIVQVRVNAVKNLIAAAPSPDINDICAKCGFADRAEAEKRFAEVCGGTGITDYARENRGAA